MLNCRTLSTYACLTRVSAVLQALGRRFLAPGLPRALCSLCGYLTRSFISQRSFPPGAALRAVVYCYLHAHLIVYRAYTAWPFSPHVELERGIGCRGGHSSD